MRRQLVLLALLRLAASYEVVSEAAVLFEGNVKDDDFGKVVSISGNVLVVGAPGEDTNGTDAGAVYVYTQLGGVWSLETRLVSADVAPGDRFGNAVKAAGEYLIVGADGHDAGGLADTGSAYIFWRSSEGWVQQAKLLGGDTMAGDKFGISVSITEEYAVVGADWHTGPWGTGCGAAYVFSSANWSQESKLLATDGDAFDRFGGTVDIDGGRVVVGALEAEENGAAYIFERSSEPVWTQVAKYVAQSNSTDSDRFASSVAVSGDTVVVGAFWDDEEKVNGGAAYIYTRNSTAWGEGTKIFAPDSAREEDRFGISVDVSGNTLIIGAYFDSRVAVYSGSAYIFAQLDPLEPSNWTFQEKVTWSAPVSDIFFGRGVGIWDSGAGPFTAVVGVPGANSTVVLEGGLPTTTTSSTRTTSSSSSSSVSSTTSTTGSSTTSSSITTSWTSTSSVTSVTQTTSSVSGTSTSGTSTTSVTSSSSRSSSTSSTWSSTSSTKSDTSSTSETSSWTSLTSTSFTRTSFTSTSLTSSSFTSTSQTRTSTTSTRSSSSTSLSSVTSWTSTASTSTSSSVALSSLAPRTSTGVPEAETESSTEMSRNSLGSTTGAAPAIDFSAPWTWEEFSSWAPKVAPTALVLLVLARL